MDESWEANAQAWIRAVSEGAIASRVSGTNAAVVDSVLRQGPRRVLDLGCGEGWLARELQGQGVEVIGIDGASELVRNAEYKGGGSFHVRTYADFARDPGEFGAFDVAVANFALLDEDLSTLLDALRTPLQGGGRLVVQTVHPWVARGREPYEDGWRTEAFAGFGQGFVAPMPWYFRTLGSWVCAFHESGYAIAALEEPREPAGQPLSLLFVVKPA